MSVDASTAPSSTATPADAERWSHRADVAQRSLEHWFAAPWPQLLHNQTPTGDDAVFNYWWLAHAVDTRLDAWHRTGDRRWLESAGRVADNILARNGGPFNDYFDDMLWYALALLRLYRVSGEQRHLDTVRQLWRHVVEHGWNDVCGPSLAWRKQSLHYKNTPANGPLIILSARLHDLDGDPEPLRYARESLRWLTDHLVTDSGFVHDGVNREDDGRIDTDWHYSYNQGLYIGALLAMPDDEDHGERLALACRTAITTLDGLGADGVFDEGEPTGDVGLFSGVTYRYLGELIDRLTDEPAHADVRRRLVGFVEAGTDRLWEHCRVDGALLPGAGWRAVAEGPVGYSTVLSAIMAVELRARLEAGVRHDERVAVAPSPHD